MFSKISYLLGICFLLISCVNTNMSNNRVDIQEFSKLVFKGYQYEYKPGIVKSSAEISNIVISKSAMTKSDFGKVEKKIIKEGWVKKYEYQGFNVYCHDIYNKLGILYPERSEYLDKDGGSIKISNFDNWLIYYAYSSSGVDGCE
ncbi:MAG: hypothetical protein L0G93_21310 [Acinetobacter sp.]|uniref:Lipoprotein n=2 Tax=Acinetobacter guillouiae TaxID=106649 RepID=A0A8X8KGF4_ACIGI|nr:hypothetical protein [Acinetobacter guillouiae]MCF0264012.1 hypothetical protein [Acinetobacter guillouiae]MDN5650846.1 hypothetical protein [Acinetobacter sp.]